MNDLDHARELMVMAEKDYLAIAAMQFDATNFHDEVFGFHAQQAVEKSLKAWLAHLHVEYPLKHDLDILFDLLASSGCVVDKFRFAADLNVFAVEHRYESFKGEKSIDRPRIVAGVKMVMEFVNDLL